MSVTSPGRPHPAVTWAGIRHQLVTVAPDGTAPGDLTTRVSGDIRWRRAGESRVVDTTSGALHGGESTSCRQFLELALGCSIDEAIDLTLERYGRLPGFGQVLYPKGDPRADLLLTLLHDAGPHPALDHVDRVIDTARRFQLPPPNVDLALAVFGNLATMPRDAGEVVFTTARIVGWVAHALEEYDERPLRFRPRAVYVGPTGDG